MNLLGVHHVAVICSGYQRSKDFYTRVLGLEVVSDAICPWCYVGKRRLAKALALLAQDGLTFTVRWLPFQLNPDMPKGGVDRRAYRTRKFGSWERSQALDARVAAVGAGDGLAFRHDLMARTPNTFDAHRLVWLAGREGTQDAVVDGLFAAGLDGLVVAAATDAHAALVKRGVAARLPVFCEKPIAPDVAGTIEVIDHYREAGVPVQVGFQRRFDAGHIAARSDDRDAARVEQTLEGRPCA